MSRRHPSTPTLIEALSAFKMMGAALAELENQLGIILEETTKDVESRGPEWPEWLLRLQGACLAAAELRVSAEQAGSACCECGMEEALEEFGRCRVCSNVGKVAE